MSDSCWNCGREIGKLGTSKTYCSLACLKSAWRDFEDDDAWAKEHDTAKPKGRYRIEWEDAK